MKKSIIRSVILTACLIASAGAFAQGTAPTPYIKGTIDIDFKTRTDVDAKGNPNPGITDLYKVDLNVAGTTLFTGEIVHTPTLFSSLIGRETQAGKLDYKITVSVVSVATPDKPEQKRAVGRLTGIVPIDGRGVYRFNDGTLRMGIDAMGTAPGFEKKFTGTANGKPPKSDTLIGRAKKQAIQITKSVNGKNLAVIVKDYDKMTFPAHSLAGGPVAGFYPDVQVTGEMLYDYERLAWYFQGMTMNYTFQGKTVTDKLSGNIRWVESPQRKTNGEGEYQFDIRVNEPDAVKTEAAVFEPVSDEGAFFESDSNLAALTGTVKYKDTMSGDTVTHSVATVDLKGNKLNKQQNMGLTKLLFISCIVPFNSE